MPRWLRFLIVAALAGATAVSAQPRSRAASYPSNGPYDGRFTFVSLRWASGSSGSRGWSAAWNHDYPRAEQHLTQIIKDLTLIDTRTDASRILALDDPELFKYPIAYMWEPGYWEWSDTGMFAVAPSNEAYKLGVNYIVCGLTH